MNENTEGLDRIKDTFNNQENNGLYLLESLSSSIRRLFWTDGTKIYLYKNDRKGRAHDTRIPHDLSNMSDAVCKAARGTGSLVFTD